MNKWIKMLEETINWVKNENLLEKNDNDKNWVDTFDKKELVIKISCKRKGIKITFSLWVGFWKIINRNSTENIMINESFGDRKTILKFLSTIKRLKIFKDIKVNNKDEEINN